jgi:hypothetical protein
MTTIIDPGSLANIQAIVQQQNPGLSALDALVAAAQSQVDQTPPSAAVEWGLTKLLWQSGPFNDLSRVDVNNANTPTSTTDWWVSDSFKGQPGEQDYGALVAKPEYFSAANGLMTIKKSADGAYYQNNQPTLQSVWWPGGSVNGSDILIPSHGRYFNGPWYVDAQFTFNQAFASQGMGFPALWADNFFDCRMSNPYQYQEFDFFEFYPQTIFYGQGLEPGKNGSVGFMCGDFRTGVTTYQPQFAASYPQPKFADLGNPAFDGTDLHTVGHRWITTGMNGGVGMFDRYFDDKVFTPNHLEYSLNGPPSFPPGAPNGTFSACENTGVPNYKGFGMFVTAGNGAGDTPFPFVLRRFRVFGKDDSGMTVV